MDSQEEKNSSLEQFLCFWSTAAIIAAGMLAWIGRHTIFADASPDFRIGLLLFYVILPFAAMGIFAMYRSRASQQWVVELCSAATFTYVILLATVTLIPEIRDDAAVLRGGLSWASATFVTFLILVSVIAPGSVIIRWRQALDNLPNENRTENKPD